MVQSRPDILLVDDEPQVRTIVATYLEREGFVVRTAADGKAALHEVEQRRPDAMVLDLMLPEIDGLEVLRRLRAGGDEVPVIVLSARGREPERVAGLELGADDYLAKPASPREIAARVRAVLRRSRPAAAGTITFGRHRIDLSARTLFRLDEDQLGSDDDSNDGNDSASDGDGGPGQAVALRPKEFDLLAHLAANDGQVMTRSDLLRDVWGSRPDWQDPGTVTVHIRRLRRLIEDDPSAPRHLVTVYGVGYRFDP